jgi:hypothetical protein
VCRIVCLMIGTGGLTCEQSSVWDRVSGDRDRWVDLRAEQCDVRSNTWRINSDLLKSCQPIQKG